MTLNMTLEQQEAWRELTIENSELRAEVTAQQVEIKRLGVSLTEIRRRCAVYCRKGCALNNSSPDGCNVIRGCKVVRDIWNVATRRDEQTSDARGVTLRGRQP